MRPLLSIMLTSLAGLIALSTPLPLRAAPAAAPAKAAAPAPAAARDQLVSLMLDEAVVLSAMNNGVDKQFTEMAVKDRAFSTMIRAYPGLEKALAERARTELAAIFHEEMPELRGRLGEAISKWMNGPQVDATIAMLRTPSGKALYEYGVRQGAAGKTTPDGAEIAKLIRPDDIPQLLLFKASGAAETFKQLGNDFSETSRQWGEDLLNRRKDRLMTAGMTTAIDFIAKQAPEKSGKDRK